MKVWRRGYHAVRAFARRRDVREAWELLVPPLDLRARTDDPIEMFYQANRKRFIVDVSLTECRSSGAPALRCATEADNPFVDTLVLYGQGRCGSYADSPLRSYYEMWQPASVAEAMGVVSGPPTPAASAPPVMPVLPWSKAHTGLERGKRLALKEFREAQRKAGVDGQEVEGALYFGPVTPAFGEATFARLASIYDSIRQHGYDPDRVGSSHIMAQLLVRDGEYRVLIRSGKHRIAALGALGYERVTVQLARRYFPALVHRGDAGSWPHVRSGFYTCTQALEIFDSLFEGKASTSCGYRSPGLARPSDRPVSNGSLGDTVISRAS